MLILFIIIWLLLGVVAVWRTYWGDIKRWHLQFNCDLRKDNTSGYRGVTKASHNRRAQIQIKGKQKFLGYFDTAEEASEAYENAFMEREGLYLKEEVNNLIYPSWCITDMRFPNELEAVKSRGGITIRVNRIIGKRVYIISNEQPFENWYGIVESYNGNNFYNIINNVDDVILVHKNQITLQDEHESETALDNSEFDYVIENNSTIEDLIHTVSLILKKEKII